VGGMTIVSLKQKYEKLYLSEAVWQLRDVRGDGGAVHGAPWPMRSTNLMIEGVQRAAW